MSKLEDIKGLGPKSLEKLEEAGISTPMSLAVESPENLASLIGMSESSARKIIKNAREDLKLGFEVARTGGTAAVVFNAANEAAVEEFLAGRIKFVTIVELIEHCLNKHSIKKNVSLEELFEADNWARKQVKKYLNSGSKSLM